MPTRYPIQYETKPKTIPTGRNWLTITVRNVGAEPLTALDVRLNSLDAYSIGVYGSGSYIAALQPDEERVIPFQVEANMTTSIYISADGWKGGDPFYWESPAIRITVGEQAAELARLFVMAKPYPAVGERIRLEATVRTLRSSEGLVLEFWADTPGGEFKELARVETQKLPAGEETSYTAEITVDEEGLYTLYAYLYDGIRRIGRETDTVVVTKA